MLQWLTQFQPLLQHTVEAMVKHHRSRKNILVYVLIVNHEGQTAIVAIIPINWPKIDLWLALMIAHRKTKIDCQQSCTSKKRVTSFEPIITVFGLIFCVARSHTPPEKDWSGSRTVGNPGQRQADRNHQKAAAASVISPLTRSDTYRVSKPLSKSADTLLTTDDLVQATGAGKFY